MKILVTDIGSYDEDFSSPSGSLNEQSPCKEPDKLINSSKNLFSKGDDGMEKNIKSEETSEEIDEVLTNTSCVSDKKINHQIFIDLAVFLVLCLLSAHIFW